MNHVVPTKYHRLLKSGKVQCTLCPRGCKLDDNERGFCFVRERQGDEVVLTTYGRSSGFCVDPIEKKPLSHFYPNSGVLSFGTAGCNLGCKFCQNWDISKSAEIDTLGEKASPLAIAKAADELGCKSVAFTYNDPVIFMEYAIDVAIACQERGIKTVAVTAGEIRPKPREEFFAYMDAANVDLKGFSTAFYTSLCDAPLLPVKETLEYLKHETEVWFEITTLLIPTQNDSDEELNALTVWIAEKLGVDVPIHFTAFHPDFLMTDLPPTPVETLVRARQIALANGLRYVYTGNVHDVEGNSTYCHACGEVLIERDWYAMRSYNLDTSGNCSHCGERCAGVFDSKPGSWGARRLPVRIGDWG